MIQNLNMFNNSLTRRQKTRRLELNTFKMIKLSKSEATAGKILDAALALFREQGFEAATMRAIAERAGVATGAAYYYYPSKDAIIMDFYRRSCEQMQEELRLTLASVKKLEDGLRKLIRVKLTHFAPNRDVLRALLHNGADPKYPLSPFSADTKEIRDLDISWFQHVVTQAGVSVPRDLALRLPGMLWFFQMGVILFWVTDDSARQERTERLLPLACKIVASLVRFSSLPLMRPLRKPILQLVEIVVGDEL